MAAKKKAKSKAKTKSKKSAKPKAKAKAAAKTAAKKAARKVAKKAVRKPAKKAAKPAKRARGKAEPRTQLVQYDESGRGAYSGGQSGDTQGVSHLEDADSESVAELLEEGQTYEAEAVAGVEDAPDADKGEVRTKQFPEDDVPEEYRDQD